MPDQKPTLEYRKPGTLPKVWKIDITICVVYATIGVACILVTALWIWQFFRYPDLRGFFMGENALELLPIPALGLVLLFLAWRILKRIKED